MRAVVDAGATRLVLPAAVAEQLGLTPSGEVDVRYADGRSERAARWWAMFTFRTSAGAGCLTRSSNRSASRP